MAHACKSKDVETVAYHVECSLGLSIGMECAIHAEKNITPRLACTATVFTIFGCSRATLSK